MVHSSFSLNTRHLDSAHFRAAKRAARSSSCLLLLLAAAACPCRSLLRGAAASWPLRSRPMSSSTWLTTSFVSSSVSPSSCNEQATTQPMRLLCQAASAAAQCAAMHECAGVVDNTQHAAHQAQRTIASSIASSMNSAPMFIFSFSTANCRIVCCICFGSDTCRIHSNIQLQGLHEWPAPAATCKHAHLAHGLHGL